MPVSGAAFVHMLHLLQVYEALVQQLEPAAPGQQQANGVAAAAAAAAAVPQPAGGPITALPLDQAALVWIQYMRFSRRSESVTASRRVGAV
jgi:hypothetical protein